jgi:hypothetical protein
MTASAEASGARHVTSCAGFWGWVGIGALAMLSLDVGPFAAGPALLLGGALGLSEVGRRSSFGVLTGAGLPLLFVAYVQRDGPGTTCYRTLTSAGCDQHLNPLPWLITGSILVLAGLIGQRRHGERGVLRGRDRP